MSRVVVLSPVSEIVSFVLFFFPQYDISEAAVYKTLFDSLIRTGTLLFLDSNGGNSVLITALSNYYPLLIPLAPLVAAALAAFPGRDRGDSPYTIGWWVFVAGSIASLAALWQVSAHNAEPIRIVLFAWPWKILPVVELSIDRLAAIMMVLISGIGTLLYRYSARYLQQDAGLPRYQTMLALAISSLLFMVSSADLVTLFIFWQLLSWLLSLLSHNYSHVPTAQASFRTFIMLRAGDIAFLAGIVLAYHLYGTVQFAPLFERAAADPTQLALLGGLTMSGATAVAGLGV